MYMYMHMHMYMYMHMHVHMHIHMYMYMDMYVFIQSVYRQSQVRKPNGSEVKWAECSWDVEFKFYSLILDSSVGLWVGIQSSGE